MTDSPSLLTHTHSRGVRSDLLHPLHIYSLTDKFGVGSDRLSLLLLHTLTRGVRSDIFHPLHTYCTCTHPLANSGSGVTDSPSPFTHSHISNFSPSNTHTLAIPRSGVIDSPSFTCTHILLVRRSGVIDSPSPSHSPTCGTGVTLLKH